ncbi:Rieske (2Fe-2S) protein [Dyella sp. A6]|uniref:Rieske (2Fe-2S) protein n=1 Tax=Dyella aluminiiresistens TaxID=3069105 RepID=UPI002E79C904|nr:Rieske (2Fe-2S) protein [Dyella sp. A6]
MDTKISPRPLCRFDELPEGEAVALDAMLPGGEENLIVLRQGGEVRAWLNICPHAGRRLDWAPGRFLISKGLLVCAVHGASFSTQNGACVGGPCRGDRLHAVPLRLDSDEVWLA